MLDDGKRQDPRFMRSYEALSGAIWELGSTRPINGITVTTLTQRAGVSRPTFYQHVSDVGELARAVAVDRLSAVTPMLPTFDARRTSDPAEPGAELSEAILPALQHLARHQRYYINVLENAATPELFDRVIALLVDRMDSGSFARLAEASGVEAGSVATIIHGGIMWRIVSWLHAKPSVAEAKALASEVGRIFVTLLSTSAPSKANS